MRATAFAALMFAAGCGPRRTEAPVVPPEGISIAIYARGDTGWATVDDRRTLEVAGDTIILDRIDPAAPLPSLVIEPLERGAGALAIIACVRDRLEVPIKPPPAPLPPKADAARTAAIKAAIPPAVAPVVRCQVRGRTGKHFVRVLHVVPIAVGTGLVRYRPQIEVSVEGGDRAKVYARYAVATPPWRARAEVTLYDGTPGHEVPPKELAHGSIELDGSVAILHRPPQELPARLRRVFDGGLRTDAVEPKDPAWRKESHQAVWVHLELEGAIPPGPVHVHHEAEPEGERGGPLVVRDVNIGALVRQRIGDVVRLPLYIDETMRGVRQHWIDRSDGATLTDRFQLSVSNLGTVAREVWIEEQLRPARHREVVRARPTKPAMSREVTRNVVTVAPQVTERVGYSINYEF